MINEIRAVPEEYQGSIKRLLNKVPQEQHDDENLIKILLVYLKLGGEKLARHHIEASKKVFPENMIIIKKYLQDDSEEDMDEDAIEGTGKTEEYDSRIKKHVSDSS